MKHLLAVALIGLLGSFSCGAAGWPRWTEQLVSKLQCGMSPAALEEQTGFELVPSAAMAELGTHVIRGRRADVWLRFEGGRLQSYLLTKPHGFKGVYLTPRTDLCSGHLSFLLRVTRTAQLEGARVYLDGELIDAFPWGAHFEVRGGRRELRIEKDGFEPIIKQLDLTAGDAGEQRLEVTGDDLRRASAQPEPSSSQRPAP